MVSAVYAVVQVVAVSAEAVANGNPFTRPAAGVAAWDSWHYLGIARFGYPHVLRGDYRNLAFFPLYPLLVRVAHLLVRNWTVSGFLVSEVAGLIACVVVLRLVSDRYGIRAGMRAGILLAAAPGAFVFSLAYAEGLVVALAAGCLFALGRRRWLVAGVLAGLATATSPVALPIVLVCVVAAAWDWWGYRRPDAAPAAVLGTLGVVAYVCYLKVATGSFGAWVTTEHHFWGQRLAVSTPWTTLAAGTWVSVIEAECLLVVLLGILALVAIRAPATWWVYAVPVVFAFTFDVNLWVNPRVLLNAWPLWVAIAVALRNLKGFVVVTTMSAAATVVALIAYTGPWAIYTQHP